jgi:hypothetical protein
LGAFNGLPIVAYKDKGKLFTLHRDTVFPVDIRIEHAILAWQTGEAAEAAVRAAISDAAARNAEREVRILKRGGKLFVTAATAIVLSERTALHI